MNDATGATCAPVTPAALEILYGGAPMLLDEHSLLRDAIGPLLARARHADFAVARFRLGAIDLRGPELAGLERCRLLLERLQAVSDGDALAASRAEVRARLALMAAFLESGRVQVRAAGGPCWAPDFSVLRDVARADGARVSVGVLGAHFFARPYPMTGPALTQVSADPHTVALLGERFEELWQGGYDVAFVIAERLRRLLGGGPPVPVVREVSAPTAAEVVRRALASRFGRAPVRPVSRVLALADFQADAVVRATAALARWGGVLLADGVGLGKTYMALALVEAELRAGGSVVVTAPAALRKEWLGPLRRLATAHGASLAVGRQAGDPPLRWVSHALLSRGAALGAPTLVVVDEAHAFRNPATRRYRALAALCRRARVVELTATPLNNAMWDLYFQIRLFTRDGAFAPVGVPDLRQAFGAGEATGEVRPILPVLREVVIRRTRPFLRDHYGAVALPDGRAWSLPRRAAPCPIRYALAPVLPGGLAAVVAGVGRLELAPYHLDRYRLPALEEERGTPAPTSPTASSAATPEPAEATLPAAAAAAAGERRPSDGARPAPGGANARLEAVGELLRCGLLKRLESSGAAFRASLRGLTSFLESFARELEAGRVLRPRDRALAGGEQLLLGGMVLAPAPAWLDRSRVLAAVRGDLASLGALLRALPEGEDGKLERLRQLVGELGERREKVIVFTEYRETAREIARALAGQRVGLVHGGGAWLGGSPVGRRELIERFAPEANGAREPVARERVDVLVATDVLAEGLNLQDARCVVSYDLPWNPVRLMQRIGRVDRLGSRHAEIRPYHFTPETGLDELLGLMRRIRRKVRLIRQALPGEPEVLETDTNRSDQLLRCILEGDGAALDLVERTESAPFEVEDRLRRLWQATARPASAPAVGEPPAPACAAMAIDAAVEPAVLLCFEGAGPAWLVYRDGHARDDDLAAASILAAALAAPETAPADGPVLRAAEAAARRVLVQRAQSGPAGGIAGRAVRRLLRELAAERHRPDAGRCARADLLMARLRSGLTAGEEQAVRDALRAGDPGDLVARLEAAIAAVRPEQRSPNGGAAAGRWSPDSPDPWGLRWRLVAAVQVRRAGAAGSACRGITQAAARPVCATASAS